MTFNSSSIPLKYSGDHLNSRRVDGSVGVGRWGMFCSRVGEKGRRGWGRDPPSASSFGQPAPICIHTRHPLLWVPLTCMFRFTSAIQHCHNLHVLYCMIYMCKLHPYTSGTWLDDVAAEKKTPKNLCSDYFDGFLFLLIPVKIARDLLKMYFNWNQVILFQPMVK